MGEFLSAVLGEILLSWIGTLLQAIGAAVMWALGGGRKAFGYYMDMENYGYIPHCIGLFFLVGILFLVIKYS